MTQSAPPDEPMRVLLDPVRVLHVDQNPTFASIAESASQSDDIQFQVSSATDSTRAVETLEAQPIDCVIAGYELPNQTGVQFLKTVRETHPDLPLILYTDAGNEKIASKAISAGVTDYIRAQPEEKDTLVAAVRDAVVNYHNQRTRRRKVHRYQAIFEDPKLLVGVLDTDGTLLEANQTAEQYIRADIDTQLGQPFWETDWWNDETRAFLRQKIEQAATGEYIEYEADLTDDSGAAYSVTGTIRPVRDTTGETVSLVVSAVDVTERKQRGKQLQQERRLLQQILDTLPDAFYQFDTDGYIHRWNAQLEAATGYSEAELDEMYVTEFVPDDETELIKQQFQTVISERQPVTVESAFETKDGERIPYEFTGAPVETQSGEIRGLIGIGRDISERKRRRRQLQAVFNNTYQFTGLMQPDGTLIEANETALSFGGLDRSDVIGEKIWDAYWFQGSKRAKETAREAVREAQTGNFFREELTVQGAERDVTIDFSVRPVTDETGRVTLLVPEGRDITRLKEREQQLEVTNRVLRHNIRNQLTLIRATADSLAETEEPTDEIKSIIHAADTLSETAEKTRKLNQLVENSPEPVTIDINDCVDRAVTTVRSRYPHADIRFERSKPATAVAVSKIETAVRELLENAVVHNQSDRAQAAVSVTTTESTVQITIIDHAGGLPEIEQRILTGDIEIDPLAHGQGLGLWYVYWILEYSGGSVSVSEHPTGSEITLTLSTGDG